MGSEINENLTRLRKLVSVLDEQDIISDYYGDTLKQIQNIIEDEKCIINDIKDNETKIKHYETVCKSILNLITKQNNLKTV